MEIPPAADRSPGDIEGLLRRGVITTNEAVTSLLTRLSEFPFLPQRLDLWFRVDPDLQRSVRLYLSELDEQGGKWRPFYIGPGVSAEELVIRRKRIEEFRERL